MEDGAEVFAPSSILYPPSSFSPPLRVSASRRSFFSSWRPVVYGLRGLLGEAMNAKTPRKTREGNERRGAEARRKSEDELFRRKFTRVPVDFPTIGGRS